MAERTDMTYKWWIRDLLELGILVAFLVFIAVIYVPRAIWNEEARIRDESRFRMENVYDVLTFYEQLTGEQTTKGLWALKVVNAVRDSMTADSTFLGKRKIFLREGDVSVDISRGTDVVYDTSFGFLKTRKDTLLDTILTIVTLDDKEDRYDTSFVNKDQVSTYRYEPGFVGIVDTTLSNYVEVVSYYDSYMPDSTMFFCPLTHLPYRIEATGEHLKVASPIRGIYKEPRYLVFRFKSGSHGMIEDGEKSWVRL